jgi:hypothetical protein
VSELDVLRDRVAELEHALGVTVVPPYLGTGLTAARRKILGMLITRPFLTKESIIIGTRPVGRVDAGDPSYKLAECQLTFVRKYLRDIHGISIRNVPWEGWYLEAGDRKKLRDYFTQRVQEVDDVLSSERVARIQSAEAQNKASKQ